jgi:hypothetical protein
LFFTHTNTLFDYLPSESIIATSEGFSALVDLSYDEINNRHQKASENFDRLPCKKQRKIKLNTAW